MKKIIYLIFFTLMCLCISISAYAAEMSYTDGTLTIIGLEENAVLFHASYENGRMSDLNITNAVNGTQKVNAENGDKFFVWSSIGNAKPLCAPVVVGETPKPVIKKTLVVYYSASGSTARIAEYIKNATDADIFEIVPKEPYTRADLNWTNSNSRVVYEYEHPEARDISLVTTTVPNWEDYDTVFIGYPIWWGIAAWPVNNFVKGNDFSGKTVIPFCTSSSSGLGQSGTLLKDMAGTGTWQTGRRFSSSASESTVSSWVNSLNIK